MEQAPGTYTIDCWLSEDWYSGEDAERSEKEIQLAANKEIRGINQ